MSTEPIDAVEHDPYINDYDQIGREGPEKKPFKYRLGGVDRKLDWPLASTRRAMQTALNENRVTDFCRLVFGAEWPDVDQALDALGPDGDDAMAYLMADYLEHIGMNEQSQERFRANREERRAERRGRGRRDPNGRALPR